MPAAANGLEHAHGQPGGTSGPAVSSHDNDTAMALMGVSHTFRREGHTTPVLEDVSLAVRNGEFVALVGPSGSGKTTILNMVAGLIRPEAGTVWRQGQPVDGPARNMGYMFARPALLPWRRVLSNVALGLEVRGVPRSARTATAKEYLDLVGLGANAASYPGQLSQGMRQRVSLARTLSTDPELLLMDEPFAALDAQTKLLLQEEFLRIWEQTRKSVMWVTHDLSEAVALADRVVLLTAGPGKIKSDTRIDLSRPRSPDQLRFDPAFQQTLEGLWSQLREEVARASSEMGQDP